MPAARASTESNTSFIIAVVIFVVLFLASAVAAIILYRERESNIQGRIDAKKDLAEIASGPEISSIKPLLDRPEAPRRATAVGELTKDVLFIADKILGQDQATVLLALRDEVAGKYESIEEALNNMAMEPKINPAIGLASIVQNLIRQIEQLQDQIFTKDNHISQMDTQHEQDLDARNTQIAQLQKQLDDEQRKAQTHETEYRSLGNQLQSRYEAIENDLRQQIASLEEQLKQAQDDNRKMNGEIKKYQLAVNQLNERLRKFQPTPEQEFAALESDGNIVGIDERERLAYINLAKGDQMYRGLKFTVYDRFAPIPKTGKGKGAIEVIEIMDTISKCRITDFDTSNPIMTNDIIANLVWSKDKKYNFCIAGDFDFDSDGLVDQDGLGKITELIEHWGGRVTPTLSVDTDFLVLGRPPAIPTKPSDEYGADSPIMQAYMQANQRLKEYTETIDNGKALDVPTFNLSRFFYFIGFFEQAKTAK